MRKPLFLTIISLAALICSCGTVSETPASPEAQEKPAAEAPIVLDGSGRPTEKETPEKEAPEKEESGVINIPVEETIAEPLQEEAATVEEEPPSFEGYVLSEEDVSENGIYLKSVKEPGRVVIDFAGDINFDDRYAIMNSLRSRGGEISSSIDPVLIKRSNDADIFMINNEFPYSSRGTPLPNKKFTFRARPETVRYMKDLGADIVSLANNHAFDHGEDALLDTFDTLDGAGIPYVGAGHDLKEAMRPVYFIAGGMKIAFVSATQIERSLPPDTREATDDSPGVLRTLEPEKFLTVIGNAKENSDFVIVYVHWGSENTNVYEAAQTELAKAYVDAGADLIIGDHPHVLQGITYIDDVPVFYSLGNYWFSSKTLDTCLVEAVIRDKRLESLQFIPCLQKGCYTHALPPGSGEYAGILEKMRNWSTENVDIDGEGYVKKR
ncbi:MAG: CapA family protein [Lachnospiraceae bacterium]|nr:CapA family protein [Lachnospiraceae bacterium]